MEGGGAVRHVQRQDTALLPGGVKDLTAQQALDGVPGFGGLCLVSGCLLYTSFTSIHPRSFRHCSFELKKGEILGVAGLVGAQRTELMEGIFGLRAHTSGKVWIKGEEVNIKQPRDAIQKSVALLTEDRRATGILGVLSVADNLSLIHISPAHTISCPAGA